MKVQAKKLLARTILSAGALVAPGGAIAGDEARPVRVVEVRASEAPRVIAVAAVAAVASEAVLVPAPGNGLKTGYSMGIAAIGSAVERAPARGLLGALLTAPARAAASPAPAATKETAATKESVATTTASADGAQPAIVAPAPVEAVLRPMPGNGGKAACPARPAGASR